MLMSPSDAFMAVSPSKIVESLPSCGKKVYITVFHGTNPLHKKTGQSSPLHYPGDRCPRHDTHRYLRPLFLQSLSSCHLAFHVACTFPMVGKYFRMVCGRTICAQQIPY